MIDTRIIIGDCLESMRAMPEQSVHCCVTSPPYFGLRDYGVDGQIGLEQTPDDFIARLVDVFREVRRVLRDDGTLWLNIGDSYAGAPGGWQGKNGQRSSRTFTARIGHRKVGGDLKPKDLIGVPWLLAFALRADGWYLRQDIIWHKPNPMPESVRDRCTKAHEYIFLLSKSKHYNFDAEAIKEPANYGQSGTGVGWGNTSEQDPRDGRKGRGRQVRSDAPKGSFSGKNGEKAFRAIRETRNKRSVWVVTTKPFKGAHFATFPPDLIEPAILAGCPVGGTVLDPFGGAGTTGLMANRLGRNAVLCELNPEYAEMARARIAEDKPSKPRRYRKAVNDHQLSLLPESA